MQIYVNYYGFVLALLYAFFAIISFFQVSRIIYYRHNTMHYQFIFFVYTGLWALLRFFFWILFGIWDGSSLMLMQGTPMLIQFATFSLLVLFYVQIIHKAKKSWKQHKRKYFILYVLVNALFVIMFLILISCEFIYGSKNEITEVLHQIEAFYVSLMYFILSVLLAIYTWILRKVVTRHQLKVPFFKVNLQIAVTVTLILVFVSRSVKDLLSGLGLLVVQFQDPSEPMDISDQLTLFFMMFTWEIVPAILVIILFWRIPNPKRAAVIPVPQPYYESSSILFPIQYETEEDERITKPLLSPAGIYSPYSTQKNYHE